MKAHKIFGSSRLILILLLLIGGLTASAVTYADSLITFGTPSEDVSSTSPSSAVTVNATTVTAGATVWTDKPDYLPGMIVRIGGNGFAPNEQVRLEVDHIVAAGFSSKLAIDSLVVHDGHDPFYETADSEGNIQAEWLVQEDSLNQSLILTAVGMSSGLQASTTFTDAGNPVAAYSQCANDDGDGFAGGNDLGCKWINGNLQKNVATYAEGEATVQRVWLDGFSKSNTTTHTITFKYGTTKQGTHAYDFLTSWYWSEDWITPSDLCQAPTGPSTNTIAGCETAVANESDFFQMGNDSNVPDIGTLNGIEPNNTDDRRFQMAGGDIISVSAPQIATGTYAGDSETTVTVTFKVPTTASAMCSSGGNPTCGVMIFFGAHIAETEKWTAFNDTVGATGIEGSPYHVAISEVDGDPGDTQGGGRDNQMQANVIVSQTLEVRKELEPFDDPGKFNLQIDGVTAGTGANVGDGGTTGPQPVQAGNHSVGETAGTGTVLTNYQSTISCITTVNGVPGAPLNYGIGTSVPSVNVPSGGSVVCTITNTALSSIFGRIRVVKVTDPNPDPSDPDQSFDFSPDYKAPFSLTNGNNDLSDLIDPATGTKSVSEINVPAAWAFVSASCKLDDGAGASTGTPGGTGVTGIAVEAGKITRCTFTNGLKPKLTVRKRVINDNGGTKTVSDFNVGTSAGSLNFDAGVPDGANTTLYTATTLTNLAPGPYSLSESNVSGYTEGSWSCTPTAANPTTFSGGSVTLAYGNNAVCTIENNDDQGSLQLVKRIVNDNGGTKTVDDFGITTDAGTPTFGAGVADGPNTLKYSSQVFNLNAATYNFAELNVAGYTEGTWSCTPTAATTNAFGGGSVAVANGVNVVCTITNNDDQGSLIVKKVVINDNGGTKIATEFAFKVNGGTAISFLQDGADTLKGKNTLTVNASVYSVVEDALPIAGYTTTYDNCTNVQVVNGGSQTCTITNDDQPGTIIIKKITKPADPNTSFVFDVTGTGYNGFSLGDGQQNSQTLNAGSYAAHEMVPPGWVLTGIGGDTDINNPRFPYACTVTGNGGSSGFGDLDTQAVSIDLKNGDTVTCVFENTGQGVTRTQGFWATHPNLAIVAWNGNPGGPPVFGHIFPGVASVAGIGDKKICEVEVYFPNLITTNSSAVMGGFWSDIAKKSAGGKRSNLDQARMQLLQQLLAAELNASAFGSVPGSGSFVAWESALCGTNLNAIKTAQQQAASFNTAGDSATFTPGTSANSKLARFLAKYSFWDQFPPGP